LDNLTEEQAKTDGWLWYAIEIPTAILAFSESEADATIVEVITGGEFCLTNVFNEKTTIATIVNSIIFGDNHAGGKAFGDFSSIESVARTKSRLAKNGVPIFSAIQEDSVIKEITKTAEEKKSSLFVLGSDFTVSDLDEKHFTYRGFGKEFTLQKPRLIGEFQINNAAIAISALLNSAKFDLNKNGNSEGVRNAYHIGRFAEIENSVVNGYEKVYFGSLKTSWGIMSFVDSVQNCDAIFTSTSDDSLLYSLNYLNQNFFKKLDKKVFISNQINENKDKKNTEFLRKIINQSKADGVIRKSQFSSAISSLSSKRKIGQKFILSIFSTGIYSFNRESGIFLGVFSQDNFEADLQFAISHDLISKDLASVMKGGFQDNLKKLSDNDGVGEFYDKIFSLNAYNLSTYTAD
jgi:folylpolyglutamate synthase/dihydropteroate synthase